VTAVSAAATTDPDAWAAAYEDLRRRLLEGSTRGSHFGLFVILREGIATWIGQGAAGSADRPDADPDRCPAAPTVSDEVHAGVVRVLAGMALSIRRERIP
jgi:hypothetical protein